ncbi:MAG: FAD-dependent oxidoreductase [Oscillospiraceae bacterium]|nr:FAD-dependent oxidoreductase [Oscillospiraceae bacterium]
MTDIVLTPASIGNVTLKNRIIFPSMCHYHASPKGKMTRELERYIEARAEGGAAVVTIPGSPYGPPSMARLSLSGEYYRADWERAAELCHKHGALLFVQLHPFKHHTEMDKSKKEPDLMPVEEINFFVEQYALAAARAKEFGVDGVELHGAHGHELHQFLSPFYNHRTDEYGGDYKGRAKMGVDMVKAMREAVGPDYPIIFKMSTSEYMEGGITIEDSVRVAALIEEAGASAINASAGTSLLEEYVSGPMDLPKAFNRSDIKAIKNAVSIPVIAINRITTMELANEILESGDADFVAMGRALLADPNAVNKYGTGLSVRQCIGCYQGCKGDDKLRIFCMQQPLTGRGDYLEYTPLPENKKGEKVLIAGAGVAGMEAAAALARRGFKPVVFEKTGRAGGTVNFAKIPPCKEDFDCLVSARIAELRELNVEVRFNTELTAETVLAEGAKKVVVATGSAPLVPTAIQGLDGKNVFTADEVLENPQLVGENVAVFGGGLVGCETAEYLGTLGKKCTIIEMGPKIATEIHPLRRGFFFNRMQKAGVRTLVGTKLLSVKLPEVTVSAGDYAYELGGFDSAIMAFGRVKVNDLEAKLKEAIPDVEVFTIGDAREVSTAFKAILSGAECAANMTV